MVHRALAASERLIEQGIDAEVIDVRSLVPLDIATIERSAAKTGRLLIVEEDHLTGGWGAEVATLIVERAFHHLRGPIRRVAGLDTPIPCAASLERQFVPSVERIVATATEMVDQAGRSGGLS
jgi:pyruvate dehydrogenase E1 component beta subunit